MLIGHVLCCCFCVWFRTLTKLLLDAKIRLLKQTLFLLPVPQVTTWTTISPNISLGNVTNVADVWQKRVQRVAKSAVIYKCFSGSCAEPELEDIMLLQSEVPWTLGAPVVMCPSWSVYSRMLCLGGFWNYKSTNGIGRVTLGKRFFWEVCWPYIVVTVVSGDLNRYSQKTQIIWWWTSSSKTINAQLDLQTGKRGNFVSYCWGLLSIFDEQWIDFICLDEFLIFRWKAVIKHCSAVLDVFRTKSRWYDLTLFRSHSVLHFWLRINYKVSKYCVTVDSSLYWYMETN